MGRKIRRVPADWEHPKYTGENAPSRNRIRDYKPLLDEDFETAARKWLDECIAWENGTHEALKGSPELKSEYPFYWEYGDDPPERDYYRPKWGDEERTHYQVYETVSEGTPVTPAFATKEELANYLIDYGDYWDQERGDSGWDRANAEHFVEREWSPSGIMVIDWSMWRLEI